MALLVLLVFFASMALVVGIWQADLRDLERQRADSHLVVLTDAGVDLARAVLTGSSGFHGRLERDVGAGRVAVDVVSGEGSWRRLRVDASWGRHRRRTLVDLAPSPAGPRVLGWLPVALDPRG